MRPCSPAYVISLLQVNSYKNSRNKLRRDKSKTWGGRLRKKTKNTFFFKKAFFKRFYLFTFREREGEDREKERERNINV